jgi:ABC-type antimicrobial peptide transport system permease subunit
VDKADTVWEAMHSTPFLLSILVFVFIGGMGVANFQYKHENIEFKDFTILHKIGMYQEYFMSYQYIILVAGYIAFDVFEDQDYRYDWLQ